MMCPIKKKRLARINDVRRRMSLRNAQRLIVWDDGLLDIDTTFFLFYLKQHDCTFICSPDNTKSNQRETKEALNIHLVQPSVKFSMMAHGYPTNSSCDVTSQSISINRKRKKISERP